MVFSTKKKTRTRRWLTVPVALVAHAIVFGGLILAGFMSVESVAPPPIVSMVPSAGSAPSATTTIEK